MSTLVPRSSKIRVPSEYVYRAVLFVVSVLTVFCKLKIEVNSRRTTEIFSVLYKHFSI